MATQVDAEGPTGYTIRDISFRKLYRPYGTSAWVTGYWIGPTKVEIAWRPNEDGKSIHVTFIVYYPDGSYDDFSFDYPAELDQKTLWTQVAGYTRESPPAKVQVQVGA